MPKLTLIKPVLILLYGFPGAGKTYFSRQLCDHIQAAHLQDARIRGELFEQPRYDREENEVVFHLMDYMTEEFLNAGMSVVYDANAMRLAQRRALRDMARKAHAQPLLVWMQIDPESSFARAAKRDRRRADDRFAVQMTRPTFDHVAAGMQNPTSEEYIVISGKHSFETQLSTLSKRLRELGIISANQAAGAVTVKPGLINLVPNTAAGRVDMSRRNITVR